MAAKLGSINKGVTLASDTEVASFTDSDLSDTAGSFTATIDWADGTTTTGTVVGSNGSFTVEGGHTYLDGSSPQLIINVTRTADSTQLALIGTVAVAGAAAGSTADLNSGMTGAVPTSALLNAGAVSGSAGGAADLNGGMLSIVKVDDNSDMAINADVARATFGVDGTGLKVGILSDSFNVLGGYSADVANENLPNNVTVLAEGPAGSTDEGRSMAELVFKDAPGAQLYFATALNDQTTFANNIAALQAAGCNIILDDFTYFAEPYYQLGDPVENAIANFVAAGGTYVTVAANDGNGFYESAFNPISFNLPGVGVRTVHDFGGGNPYEQVTLANDGGVTNFWMQWAQPFKSIGGGSGSNDSLSFYVFGQNHNFLFKVDNDQVGNDPVQGMFMNDLNGAVRYVAVADDFGPVPSQFKMVVFANGNGTVLDGPGNGGGSGTITGHNEDPNAITVAAVDYTKTPNFGTNPPVVEDFSGIGPGELLFDKNGNLLPSPVFLEKPDIAGPDGSATDPLNPFFGTSAAAPNIGAVAALVMQENRALTSRDIENLLEDSAIVMANPLASGAGLVQADKAVQFASTRTIAAFTGGNSTLLGTHLNDTFVGDGQVITAVFTGPRADYSIVQNADGSLTITDNRPGSPDGTDKLIDIGFARFANETITFQPFFGGSGTFDADADRNGDLLWQEADGTVSAWDMQGSQIASKTTVAQVPSNWHIAGTGHFFGANGGVAVPSNTDAIFRSDAGDFLIVAFSGNQIVANQLAGHVPPNWHIAGIGDFNGDGKSDVLWQSNAHDVLITEMNGAQVIVNQFIGPAPGGGQAMAVDDFNGDGKADIVFQTPTGDLVMWEMNGTQIAVNQTVGHLPASWQVAA